MERRQFVMGSSALLVLVMSGCAEQNLRYSLTEVVRRLLTISSQRALARLMAPGGFYDSQVARITLPDRLSGKDSLLTKVLMSAVLRERMLRQINRAAERGAERAAPAIADAIMAVSPQDAAAIVYGRGPAATDLLRQTMGDALFSYMLPGVDEGLRLFDDEVVNEVLRLATGIDFAGLRADIARKAADAIFREMGREEVSIRADPHSTHDPVLIRALSANSGR